MFNKKRKDLYDIIVEKATEAAKLLGEDSLQTKDWDEIAGALWQENFDDVENKNLDARQRFHKIGKFEPKSDKPPSNIR